MKNRHNKRAWWHDYYSRSIYLITINKRPEAPSFGHLIGDWRIPAGCPGCPEIWLSDIGKIIRKKIKDIPSIIPNSQLYQYIVMPDHIHFLIFIKDRTPYHLGRYISAFKNEIRLEVGMSVFQTGFNDKILSVTRKLNDIFRYIRENPLRLAIMKANSDNFKRCDSIRINGMLYTGYGNLHLLKNPFREAVIVHRKSSDIEKERQKKRWRHLSYSGGVLVSPFIPKEKKDIRKEAEKLGGRIILIVDKPLPQPPWKPSFSDFYRCEKGELLILAPVADTDHTFDLSEEPIKKLRQQRDAMLAEVEKPARKKKIARSECLRLNALAEYICSDRFNSNGKT